MTCPAACPEGGHDGRIGDKEGCPLIACPTVLRHKVRKPCGRRQGKAQPWGYPQGNHGSFGFKAQHVVTVADKTLGHEAHGEGALASAVVPKDEQARRRLVAVFTVRAQKGPVQAKQSPASAQVGHHGDVEAAQASGKALFPAHAKIEGGILLKNIGAVPVDLDVRRKVLVLPFRAQEKKRLPLGRDTLVGPERILPVRLLHLFCWKDKAHGAGQPLKKQVLPRRCVVHAKKSGTGNIPVPQETIFRSHRSDRHRISCHSGSDGWGLCSGCSGCRDYTWTGGICVKGARDASVCWVWCSGNGPGPR